MIGRIRRRNEPKIFREQTFSAVQEYLLGDYFADVTQPLESDTEITSLDDVPQIARLAARQQFLAKWYRGIAMTPFGVLVLIVIKFFGESTSIVPVITIEITLLWAMAVAAYTFYLLFAVKCPRCGRRFGSRTDCNSCRLPRHRHR